MSRVCKYVLYEVREAMLLCVSNTLSVVSRCDIIMYVPIFWPSFFCLFCLSVRVLIDDGRSP